jgi:hypothetical protein
MDKADENLKAIVGEGPAFQRYLVWRRTTDRWVNPLEFIMRPKYPVNVELTPQLVAKGWRIRYLEERSELAKYGLKFYSRPIEVILFEKGPASKSKVTAYVHVVVYRADDFYEFVPPAPTDKVPWEDRNLPRESLTIMKQIPLPEQPKNAPELFWADHQFVIFISEGTHLKEQKLLQREVRHQLWRPKP